MMMCAAGMLNNPSRASADRKKGIASWQTVPFFFQMSATAPRRTVAVSSEAIKGMSLQTSSRYDCIRVGEQIMHTNGGSRRWVSYRRAVSAVDAGVL